MKSMKIFVLVVSVLLFASCVKNKNFQNAESAKADTGNVFEVKEVVQTTNYSYLRVFEKGSEKWVAVSRQEVNVGDVYYYEGPLQMNNFHSKELDRNFETIFFLKYKLLGFKFAPFASADLSYFTPVQKNISNSGFYLGLGGGIRTRNENILFKTIEMRFMYFPRKSTQHNAFKFSFITNLRFRYNNNYVKAPEIIMVNSDFTNNIY